MSDTVIMALPEAPGYNAGAAQGFQQFDQLSVVPVRGEPTFTELTGERRGGDIMIGTDGGAGRSFIGAAFGGMEFASPLVGAGEYLGGYHRLDALFRACGIVGTRSVDDASYGESVIYAPSGDISASVVLGYIRTDDSRNESERILLPGARGTASLMFNAGDLPRATFSMQGLYQRPEGGHPRVVGVINELEQEFTLSAVNGTTFELVTGGSADNNPANLDPPVAGLSFRQLELHMNNVVQPQATMENNEVRVYRRSASAGEQSVMGRVRIGFISPEKLDAWTQAVEGGHWGMRITHGNRRGSQVILRAAAIQLVNPSRVREGEEYVLESNVSFYPSGSAAAVPEFQLGFFSGRKSDKTEAGAGADSAAKLASALTAAKVFMPLARAPNVVEPDPGNVKSLVAGSKAKAANTLVAADFADVASGGAAVRAILGAEFALVAADTGGAQAYAFKVVRNVRVSRITINGNDYTNLFTSRDLPGGLQMFHIKSGNDGWNKVAAADRAVGKIIKFQ